MGLNIVLIGETFERAKKENGGLTNLGLSFYKRLFEKYPQVKPLFNTPPEEQHKKLMASLGSIVASVTQPDKMVPYLHAMGIRHLKYKTETPHYGAVQENLLAVLKNHLSQEGTWTADIEENWSAALKTVSDIMIDAAEHPDNFKAELEQAGYLADGFKTGDPTPWVLATA